MRDISGKKRMHAEALRSLSIDVLELDVTNQTSVDSAVAELLSKAERHVCEYLAAAAKAIESQPAAQQHWLDEQKHRLKIPGGLDAVLRMLQTHREPADTPDEDAPVRQCRRYLSNRQDQLDYPDAVGRDLPIGSGEIESAHRYVVQRRLKLPGAWWEPANAQHMLSLRVNRANAKWHSYWARDFRFAA
jgi:hypothetical protein